MNWQFTPFLIPTILAGGVAAALTIFAWSRRHSPGAPQFLVLMAGVVIWCLGYAWELAASEFSAKHFGVLIKYLGVVLVSPAFLVFVLKYSGKEDWLNLRILLLLAIEPIVALFLIWTNDYHGLMWTSIRLEDFGSYRARISSHGLVFYLHRYLRLPSFTSRVLTHDPGHDSPRVLCSGDRPFSCSSRYSSPSWEIFCTLPVSILFGHST